MVIRKDIVYILQDKFLRMDFEIIDTEEIIIGAEFYNEIGDLDNVGDVIIELIQKDSLVFKSELQRTSSKYRQNIGRWSPGVYSVRAKFKKGNKEITKTNSFFVNELTVEAENLSMNYSFLSELSNNSGATYVSPFVGRLDDQSVAGLEVVRSIVELYRIHGIRTRVLSASIRSVQRVVRSFYNGADVVTLPPAIFEQMYDHILTDKGLEIFDKDAAEIKHV